MLIKFHVHSVVDVITNSSTTIYSYCDGCVGPAKELINEFINAFGGDELKGKTSDDLFFIDVFAETDRYVEFNENGDGDDDEDFVDPFEGIENDYYGFVDNLIEQILKGDIEKPDWMKKVEDDTDYNDYSPSNTLYIVPKDEKYEKIGKLLLTFLHSTQEEAGYD